MTIKEVGMTFYLMEEDTINYEFTDEMIECLVDEPQEKNENSNVKNVISTRKAQIFEYLKERNIPFDSLEANSIMEGIRWADEHPDSEHTYTKQQWIEKARRWLKSNTNWDDEWDEMGRNANYGKIEEFCKVMEE
jgi:hypothetical protein